MSVPAACTESKEQWLQVCMPSEVQHGGVGADAQCAAVVQDRLVRLAGRGGQDAAALLLLGS